ncbi:prevent-host-death protein [Parabacteroides sp. OttesenSCG-928-K15]|nr:prevent-host-death protein [Parabacteroides sp. OttesenSCG-928-K15]
MIIISSKEFRDNQKTYFDRVDSGEQVIVQRGKNKSYMLQPIQEEDYFFTPKMLERIDESMQQIREGKGIELSNIQELKEFLKNL